ncbi:MAG: MoaD/ThiS family protein [Candidatus Promineofilum sp.]|nr:MoaD/ThiS family protein [Promineifilum sp.]
MKVEVRLYGSLRRYRPATADGSPHQPFAFALSAGSSIDDLGRHLGLPEGLVSAAAVNGEAVENSIILREGDRVSLFPPSAGG